MAKEVAYLGQSETSTTFSNLNVLSLDLKQRITLHPYH